MFLASVAAWFLSSAEFPCCDTAKECIARLRSVKSVAEPSRPLHRSCEAGFLAKQGQPVAAQLLELLMHPAWETRDAAAVALAGIRPASRWTLHGLHELAKRDPDGWVIWALAQLRDVSSAPTIVAAASRGRSVPTLEEPLWSATVPLAIKALRDSDDAGRRRLFEIIEAHPQKERPLREARALLELLDGELSEPVWTTPCVEPPFDVQPPKAPTASPFECVPFAGALVGALGRYGPDASFAESAVEAAAARDPHVKEIAQRVLLLIGASRADDRLLADLRSSDRKRVVAAISHIAFVPDSGVLLDEAERLVTSEDPVIATASAQVLIVRGRGIRTDAIRRGLTGNRIDAVDTSLRLLAAVGPAAKELEPEVRVWLASPHVDLRNRAVTALSSMLGRPATARPPRCYTGALPRFEDPPVPSCFEPRACLRLENRGEFGGKVEWLRPDGGVKLVSDDVIPLRVVEVGTERVLIEGLAHMGGRRGSIWHVVESPNDVTLEFVTDVPGYPVGWSVSNGGLTLEVNGGDERCTSLVTVPTFP